ncbi:hypothetical protein [Anatilimnocola aggregata]|uniref:hypothetical protein n=1 Tax=Anatilimnocola aggregata TaxID=2528021 RepID=UPI00192E419C|nr:hypothetical protein [Anatilimnocola aggregata]
MEHTLRVHDSQSGETLFAAQTPHKIDEIALSADGKQFAAITSAHKILTWKLPE